MGIGEIDREVAPALRHLRADVHVPEAVAVVVEDRLAPVHPVLPGGDAGARLALGAVQDRVDRRPDDRRAVLLEEREEPALPDPGGADHRRQIALEVARVADVGRDHLEHVVADGPRLPEPERGDADPLLPDLGRPRVVGAVRGAADVALVRTVDRPEEEPLAGEHRDEGREVRQVVVAVIGVVQEVDVAGPHAVTEELLDGPDGPRDRADVDRHVLRLGDEPALGVAEGGGEVTARVEDLRVRGAEHRLAHLLHDGLEPVLDDRDGDRIDALTHGSGLLGALHLTRPARTRPGAARPKTRSPRAPC